MARQKDKAIKLSSKTSKESMLLHIRKEWKLYSLMLLPLAYYVIFKYIPMAGNIIAFRTYKGGSNIFGESWVGLRYFKQFIGDSSFWNAFWNTLKLNISYLLVRFPATSSIKSTSMLYK